MLLKSAFVGVLTGLGTLFGDIENNHFLKANTNFVSFSSILMKFFAGLGAREKTMNSY